MEKIRVAILGVGKIGKYHVREFSALGAEVVAILCSTRESASKKAEELKKEFNVNVRAYHKLEELIKWESLDAVSICTPPEMHENQIRLCLENNLHVICEKPFVQTKGNNHRIAEELFNLAEKRKKLLTINTQWISIVDYFRRYPDLNKLRNLSIYMEPAESGISMIMDHLPHTNSILIGLIPNGKAEDVEFLSKSEEAMTVRFKYRNSEQECEVVYDFKLRTKTGRNYFFFKWRIF